MLLCARLWWKAKKPAKVNLTGFLKKFNLD